MKAVIDTNVLLVANGSHPDVSPKCVIECVNVLENLKQKGQVVVDDAFLILNEYQNKTTPLKNKRAGDVFLLWLLKNLGTAKRVHKVQLTSIGVDEYAEFPDADLQQTVDPPDRKFIAAAAAAGDALVVQATDCKWLDWWPRLKECNVEIAFVCPDDVCGFYAKKFPSQHVPELP